MGEVTVARERGANALNAMRSRSSRQQSPFDNMDWYDRRQSYNYYATITKGRKDDVGRSVNFRTSGGYSSIHDGLWRELGYSNTLDDHLELTFRYVEDRDGNVVWKPKK